MTVQDKEQLVNNVTAEIGEFLTVVQTNKVKETLANELQSYDVVALTPGEVDTDSMNMLQFFLDAKRTEGRSEGTINRYSYHLEKLLFAIGVPIKQITVYHLRAYLMEEKKRGLSDRSLEGIRSIMSSFFGWLWKENLLPINPCGNIAPIKCRKEIRLPFSAVELEKLKSGCTNARDKAIVYFLLGTGARISEVCALNRDDVDFQKMECMVLGKGNKERTVYFDSVTAMVLRSYLLKRTDESPALFSGNRKNRSDRLTPHGVRGMLNHLGERAGVENVHPHRFRRTLATNLIDHGMPIQEVSSILGHENINTTMKYVFVDKNNVKNSYRKYF